MKIGFELIAPVTSWVSAVHQKIKKTLTDAFLAAKLKVLAKVRGLLQRVKKRAADLREKLLSPIRRLQK